MTALHLAPRNVLKLGFLWTIVVLGAASTTRAELIARWQFDPGINFLADSSGNGHTLVNTGVASSPDAPGPFSNGSAEFDGADILRTATNLDLTPYKSLSISWYQRNQMTGIGVLFEHSQNKNTNNNGGWLADVNELGPGIGFPDISMTTGNNGDRMPHAIPTGANPTGVWENFTMTLDIKTTNPSNVLTVTGGTDNAQAVPAANEVFLNDIFFIGARGQGTQFGFVGRIDDLQIDGVRVPEPASLALLGVGILGLAIAARRRRKAC